MKPTSSRSQWPALGAALLAAAAASVCCVVPLVLVLLGIGGAWVASLTAFETFRPGLSVVALLCLGWAFRVAYARAPRCSADVDCVDPRRLRRRRRWLWVAAALVALLLLFPYYVGWLL
ncbi:mercuric transporter MerT family protein [Rehaibacterium terrae]|jgi:mercuric ion transport protein|uniref:Mercuric transport protein MerT n=1 Tax=Rehaibacterium terrae TaxID=1341696 RepID=A0A7W7XZN0_9GAMM|nr:mercuric transporter MerT family protein [Rehaibacterium terrae]MBB5015355.1 mercuric ion transport protein [Rehaibacterium terrae]